MCLPPLSTKSYISFVTTSVASPMRWKTPRSSSNGEITWPYPAASTTDAKTVTNCRQRADSGGRMSRIPGLVWNSGMSNKAIGGAHEVSRLCRAALPRNKRRSRTCDPLASGSARPVVVVLEQPAHDLARCRDGYFADELHGTGELVCSEVFSTMRDERLCRHCCARLEYDVGLGEFTFDLVGNSGDRGQGDCRVHAQDTLDLCGVHVEAGSQDHVGFAIDDREIAVLVHRCDVARVQPAIRFDGGSCRVRISVVAVHHHRAAEHQLTSLTWPEHNAGIVDIDDPHLIARVGDSDRAGLVRPDDWVGAGRTSEFGHTPDLVNWATRSFGELDRLR